jgi:hypothetical protein
MAFTVAQAIMIHRAQFTSNATVIAHLLFFEFRGLEATSATHGTKVPTKSQRRVCEASRVPADRKRGSIGKWVFTWWNTSGARRARSFARFVRRKGDRWNFTRSKSPT